MPFKAKINWEEEIPNIIQMGVNGCTMQDIANVYNVSCQRIQQILKKKIPEWNEKYGILKRRADRIEIDKVNRRHKNGVHRHLIDEDLYWSQRKKFVSKRAHAKRLGFDWDIAFGDIDWPSHCPILGLELDYFAPFRQENSPSFDQINPGLGYIVGNVLVISWRANRIKNDGTPEEHRRIADFLESL